MLLMIGFRLDLESLKNSLARTLEYFPHFKGGDFWVWSLRGDAHLYGVRAPTSHHLQWNQVNKYFMQSFGKYKALLTERTWNQISTRPSL